jgi:hypothetical protein
MERIFVKENVLKISDLEDFVFYLIFPEIAIFRQ